ncbi:MAG TPA: 4'-phosphopantetheinyl transferase superfamily protein, partial [Anaerolineae bacterium]|nr:4'-phosphopantetheinyl transferase superfamily protein [Anaerolineae bacterium]
EQTRAARFHFEHLRHHYTAGRAILRHLISHYLQLTPASIRFSYNQYGRPQLSHPQNDTFQFNLSHSGDWLTYAFALGHPLGIDVEQIRPLDDAPSIAQRFFSPRENEIWATIPPHLQPQAFFNCWTRKEAYIKAHGLGLSLPLDAFDVTLQPGQPAKLLATRYAQDDAQRWHLHSFHPDQNHVGALAVAHHDLTIQYFDFHSSYRHLLKGT